MGPETLAIISLVSTAFSALGTLQQGFAAEAQAEDQARAAELEAQQLAQAAAVEERHSRRASQRLAARQRAVAASQGFTFEGSPLAIIAETAAEAELDALTIRASGSRAVLAANQRAAARRREGQSAKLGGIFGAGAKLLTGASGFESLLGSGPAPVGTTGAGGPIPQVLG